MPRRLLIVLGFAATLGLAASALVYQVLVRAAHAGTDQSIPVVVAAVDMELAETVSDRHVKLVRWPRASVPVGTLPAIADVQGRVVRSSIIAGEPLLEQKLAPTLAGRGGVMPMLVPEGRRGVTIRVDDAIKESGFIQPNSRVDILVSMTKDGGNERVAKMILQDVPVLAAGQSVEMRDNKPVPVTTVTLALTPEEAERLALAHAHGKITIATRNLRDDKIVETPGINAPALLGEGRPTARMAATTPAPPRAALIPLPRIESHTVAVLRGQKLSEHRFVRDGRNEWTEHSK